jgi:WhiB family transcriptional regulator, redox-sensing transcriptional regulator
VIIDASRWELEPTPWMTGAVCAGCDPDLWFASRGSTYSDAKQMCHTCPAERQCLDYALRWNIDYGVWGGTSPSERHSIRARTNPPRPRLLPAAHGTTSRYARGCRCEACAQAHSFAARQRDPFATKRRERRTT